MQSLPWYDVAKEKCAATSKLVEPWLPVNFNVSDEILDVMDVPSKYLSAEEDRITLMTATTLVNEMGTGLLQCEVVLRAFCKRAAIAHKLVGNPVTRSLH